MLPLKLLKKYLENADHNASCYHGKPEYYKEYNEAREEAFQLEVEIMKVEKEREVTK